MVFSSLFFLFVFLPAFLLAYTALRAKNAVLVVFSLLFYAWGEPVYVFLMLAMVGVNYLLGRIIDSRAEHRRRKRSLVAGVTINVLSLVVFKYAGLAATTFGLPDPHILLPIGISFYTFQSISYLIDVYRRQSPAQRRFADLLLYISMFPQLIAGPIVRYGTVAAEINHRHASADDIAEGTYRFFLGLGKKVILANQLGLVADQFLTSALPSTTATGALLGLVAYTLQIYFDFSGYSDMAIGIGRCLGFHFLENFDHPYCARSLTDFWRRWHISLGSFFRDYVYIPLGGNRRHQGVNILLTWLLTGFWHGASWNFALWGLYYGLLLTLEKYTVRRLRVPHVVGWAYMLPLVVVGWALFYFTDYARLTLFFQRLLSGTHNIQTTAALFDHFWLWLLALAACLPLRRWVHARIAPYPAALMAVRLAATLLLIVTSVTLLIGETNNPFIYTRF